MNYVKQFSSHIIGGFFSWALFFLCSFQMVYGSSSNRTRIESVADWELEDKLYNNPHVDTVFNAPWWKPDYAEVDKNYKRFQESRESLVKIFVEEIQKPALLHVLECTDIENFPDFGLCPIEFNYYAGLIYKSLWYADFLVFKKDTQILFEQKYNFPIHHDWYEWVSKKLFDYVSSFCFDREITALFDILKEILKDCATIDPANINNDELKMMIRYAVLGVFHCEIMNNAQQSLDSAREKSDSSLNYIKRVLRDLTPFSIPSEQFKQALSLERDSILTMKWNTFLFLPEDKYAAFPSFYNPKEREFPVDRSVDLLGGLVECFFEWGYILRKLIGDELKVIGDELKVIERSFSLEEFKNYYKNTNDKGVVIAYRPTFFATVDDLKGWASKE